MSSSPEVAAAARICSLVRWGALALLLASIQATALAQTCDLGPVAVDDVVSGGALPQPVDPLNNDSHPEGQALRVTWLAGGTTCAGPITQEMGLLTIAAQPFPCVIEYRLTDEDDLTDKALIHVSGNGGGIFADGFESGSTHRWCQVGC